MDISDPRAEHSTLIAPPRDFAGDPMKIRHIRCRAKSPPFHPASLSEGRRCQLRTRDEHVRLPEIWLKGRRSAIRAIDRSASNDTGIDPQD